MKFSSYADVPKEYSSLCQLRHSKPVGSNDAFEAVVREE